MTDAPHDHSNLLAFCVHGMTPFLTHADSLDDRLAEASALLTVIASALDVADEAIGKGQYDAVDGIVSLRSGIYARAFEGVRTLVHMANYHADNVGSH